MDYHRFLAILAVFFLFQNTFPGNDEVSQTSFNTRSENPIQAPGPIMIPLNNSLPFYSVSIAKKLYNGTPLTQEEKRFPKIALGLTCAINALFIPACLKMQGHPVSVGNVAALTIVALPITWFFSEFLNCEWDD